MFFQPNALPASRHGKNGKYLKRRHPWVGDARCVLASAVASVAHHPRLVEGHPQLHTVPKCGEAEGCVVQEGIHHVLILPPATILQGLRQVPVEECGHRLDVRVQQAVNQLVVVGNAPGVGVMPLPSGEYAGPGDGELVDLGLEATEQGDVSVYLVVTVAGHLWRCWALGGVLGPDSVPDARPSSILGPASFHLKSSRGDTPEKAFRKNILQESISFCLGLVGKRFPDSLIG